MIVASACLLLLEVSSPAAESSLAGPTWVRLYQNLYNGSTVDTSASDIYPTSDGGAIAVGVTPSPSGEPVGWVVKLDASGHAQWGEEVGPAFTYPASIEQTADGGFVVAGGTLRGGDSGSVCDLYTGVWCAWVVKLDPVGGVEWQKVYATGDSTLQTAWAIRQAADGGYVIAGASGGQTDYGAWIAALDPAGEVRWQKVFGGTSQYDVANFESVQPTTDGGYIAAGWSTVGYDDQGMQLLTAFVVKLDSDGRVEWQEQYSNFDGAGVNIGGSRASSIVQASDGGYLVGGSWGDKTSPLGARFLLLKLDSGGGVEWQKAYDGGVKCFWDWLGYYTCVRLGGFIYSLRPSPDGGYLLSGIGQAVIGDPVILVAVEAWLGKVDSNGNFLWQNTYFPTYQPTGLPLSSAAFYDVGTTGDGGIVAIGTTAPYTTLQNNLYIVKADAAGNVEACTEVHTGVPLIAIDPSLVANAPSLPISDASALTAPAAGSSLQTSVGETQSCGTQAPTPPLPHPRRRPKKG